jgi:ubiquinone/menaquinone biosynthesis C-methylase UbiE
MLTRNENEINSFFERFKSIEVDTVLDLATGRGEFLEFLRQSLGKVTKMKGIDTHGRMLEMARESFPDAEFELMDAYKTDYPDRSIDLTSVSNSLHHFSEPELVLNEMLRITKPGGYLVVREMVGDSDQTASQMSHVLIHHFSAEIDRLLGREHRETYSEKDLTVLLDSIPVNEKEYMVFDYSVSDEDIMQNNENYIRLIDTILKPVAESSEFKQLSAKGQRIKEHIQNHGFAPARTLFYLGRK